MSENNQYIVEKLSASDPIEKWIADFVSSDDPRFDGKSKEERIKMALGAYYGSKNESVSDKRSIKMLSMMLENNDNDILRYFIESTENIFDCSILETTDKFKIFLENLIYEDFTPGAKASVKCIKKWGACDVGKVYDGVWKQAGFQHSLRLDLSGLPGATSHPSIFYNTSTKKLDINKSFELV